MATGTRVSASRIDLSVSTCIVFLSATRRPPKLVLLVTHRLTSTKLDWHNGIVIAYGQTHLASALRRRRDRAKWR